MPAGNTYEAIATQSLGSAAASVTFSSIPGTYTDLVLVSNPIYSTTAATKLQINNSTAFLYSGIWLQGNGSTAGSLRNSSGDSSMVVNYFNNTSSDKPMQIFNFQNYSNATTFKTYLIREDNAGAGISAFVGLFRDTAAITQFKLSATTGNYSIGSTFSLYGIKAA
jgi:hypothetical protein